jgi:hypothetical protein
MHKIPTLYVRDPENHWCVTDQITEGCEWALKTPARPTRMWDGACTMLDSEGRWWARREVKAGKTAPSNWLHVSTDTPTGKAVGWEPAGQSSHARFHAEAVLNSSTYRPGTYELLGPNINNNPEGFNAHVLVPHGWAPLPDRLVIDTAPKTFEGLRDWIAAHPYKGLVWHHPDGRRAKLKKKDFAR